MARDSGKKWTSNCQSNLADLFFTQGNKEKAIFWAKKAYRNGAKLPDELKILININ